MSIFSTTIDKLGGVRISIEDRDELLREFDAAEVSAAKFAEGYGGLFDAYVGEITRVFDPERW